MHGRALLLALALAVTDLACAQGIAAPFKPPEDGGPPWHELTSAHFVVRTDLAETDGQSVVAALEQSYAALADVAFPFQQKPEGRTRVLVVRNHAEYELLAPSGSAGFYRRAADPTLPTLYFYGNLSPETEITLQHELTHRFVHFYFPGAPRWVNEGLAEYYSTMTLVDGKAVLGRELPRLRFRPGMLWDFQNTAQGGILWVPTGLVPTVAAMRGSTHADFSRKDVEFGQRDEQSRRVVLHYAGAWALVHFLKNTAAHAPQFDAFMLALGAGKSAEQAWTEAFRATSEAALETGFQEFLRRRDTTILRTAYQPTEPPLAAARTMTPDEVHLLWAAIRPWKDEAALRQARIDVGAALAIAPNSPEARLWRARLARVEGDVAAAERSLREALALRPDDERLTLELFHLYDDQLDVGPDGKRDFSRTDALVPVLQKIARSPRTHNALAWYLVYERNRPDDALPHAAEAVRDYSCFECFDTLALVFSKKGAHVRALEMQTIALNLAPDGFSDETMLARWSHYREAAPAAIQTAGQAPQPEAQPAPQTQPPHLPPGAGGKGLPPGVKPAGR